MSASRFVYAGSSFVSVDTKSWQELRQRQLVRQQWDISCGAAALSTLLTWFYDLPLDEQTVAKALLQTTKVQRVRARGGFSLLDLKRFVEAIGFRGEGYGKMTLADLDDMNLPAIVPIYLYGLDHFVIYRGLVGDKVFIGDPAFGNLTMSKSQFVEVWKSRVGFFVVSDELIDFKRHSFHGQPSDDYAVQLVRGEWRQPQPIIPITRRKPIIKP